MVETIYSKEHKLVVKKLKEARREAGFDQRAVAEKLGKTQSYVSKIESGQRRIDLVQLNRFAKIYKKNIQFFLS